MVQSAGPGWGYWSGQPWSALSIFPAAHRGRDLVSHRSVQVSFLRLDEHVSWAALCLTAAGALMVEWEVGLCVLAAAPRPEGWAEGEWTCACF